MRRSGKCVKAWDVINRKYSTIYPKAEVRWTSYRDSYRGAPTIEIPYSPPIQMSFVGI